MRPWAGSPGARSREDDDDDVGKEVEDDDDDEQDDEDMEIEVDEEKVPQSATSCSPLDALFEMTSKTFDGRDGHAHLLDGTSVTFVTHR